MIRTGLALSLVLLLGLPARAAEADRRRASLEGLRVLAVVVEDVSAEAETGGLTKASLQTAVELRLRTAGLRVAERSDAAMAPAFVWVQVTTFKAARINAYAYSIAVELTQPVTLVRDPAKQQVAATWKVNGVRLVHGSEFAATVRADVGDFVDQFLNDYLAANPKP